MAKTAYRKPKQVTSRPVISAEQFARAHRYLRIVLHTSIALILLGSIAWLVTKLKTAMAAHVENAIPAVVFTDKPAWMTDLVASHLAESFRPAKAPALFDREALVDVNRRLKANPWVAEVRQVRRVYDAAAGDTIEVDCTFREPAALVHEPGVDRYWFVDRQGVLLPEHFESSELSKIIYVAGKVNMRIVDGVLGPPPVAPGKLWTGDDLQAGLDLAGRLAGLPFADDVTSIDVTNYAGRVTPGNAHLVLMTKYQTQVRWGRPWIASDAFVEVKPEKKLEAIRTLGRLYGRVDANCRWVDLRFDQRCSRSGRRSGDVAPPLG